MTQPLSPPPRLERLQKVLAHAGIGSRRKSEELIEQGRVTVDGRVAALGERVDPLAHRIEVDGVPLGAPQEPFEYWVLNKPAGVVSSSRDPQGRPTVVDLVPSPVRLYPVGRLDLDTTGVILLTNDGELAHRLAHPRFQVDKEYQVLVRGQVGREEMGALRRGVLLEDGMTSPVEARLARSSPEGSVLMLVLHEGRKRQVRRMMEALGHSVLALHRKRVDGIDDRALSLGQSRRLTQHEVRRLQRLVGLEACTR